MTLHFVLCLLRRFLFSNLEFSLLEVRNKWFLFAKSNVIHFKWWWISNYVSDLSDGIYIPQESASCQSLCKLPPTYLQGQTTFANVVGRHRWETFGRGGRNETERSLEMPSADVSGSCCDPKATCTCGTHTGHFACICPLGHYGRGMIGDCKRKLPQSIVQAPLAFV